jgi:hypothetical protein
LRNSGRISHKIEAATVGGLFHFKLKSLAPCHETDITGGRVNGRCRGKRPSIKQMLKQNNGPNPGDGLGPCGTARERRAAQPFAAQGSTRNLFALFNTAHVAEKTGVIHGKTSR